MGLVVYVKNRCKVLLEEVKLTNEIRVFKLVLQRFKTKFIN